MNMESKIESNRIGSNKIQLGVNVTCMQNNFGGHGLSGFGDFAPFHFPSNFLFGQRTIVHGLIGIKMNHQIFYSIKIF